MSKFSKRGSWPQIIQGGMGPDMASWRLARTVALTGKATGTISCILSANWAASELSKRDDDVLRMLEKFRELFPFATEKYLDPYVGRNVTKGLQVPMFQIGLQPKLDWLTIFGAYAKTALASEGHDQPILVNLLEHLQDLHMPTLMGVIIAFSERPTDAQCGVVAGAGLPWQFPSVLASLAGTWEAKYEVSAKQQVMSDDGLVQERSDVVTDRFSLPDLLRHDEVDQDNFPQLTLRVPEFFAIVSTYLAVQVLERKAEGQITGYVVERKDAAGHNASPRDKKTSEYGPKDEMDFTKLNQLGKPFWIAGAQASPEALEEARVLGAVGIQCGSIFALTRESGVLPRVREQMIAAIKGCGVEVVRNFSSSPTGYPFMVALLKGTLGEEATAAKWQRQCTIGALRERVVRVSGNTLFRCPADKVEAYVKSGGTEAETVGRNCLCRSLSALSGMVANTAKTHDDPPILTFGLKAVPQIANFFARIGGDLKIPSATAVVEYLLLPPQRP